MSHKHPISTAAVGKFLFRRPKLFTLIAFMVLGVFSSSAFCNEAQDQLLNAGQVQARLNSAGYAPLWQIRRSVAGYIVEGIDPRGNPVVLQVDPFNASIIALEAFALLR